MEERLTYEEFKQIWNSLSEDQKQSVKDKARWENMTLWAICDQYPGIWNDEYRLKEIRKYKKEPSK